MEDLLKPPQVFPSSENAKLIFINPRERESS